MQDLNHKKKTFINPDIESLEEARFDLAQKRNLKKINKEKRLGKLRARAESALGNKILQESRISKISVDKMIHELSVYQTELEMQNEELREAQILIEESRNKYFELYDFAPVGYLTLGDKGLIKELNLAGAGILGLERSKLINTSFTRYISGSSQGDYYKFIKAVKEFSEKQSCTLEIEKQNHEYCYCRLEGINFSGTASSTTQTQIALIDITKSRLAEQALADKETEYHTLFNEAREGILLTDANTGAIVSCNPEFIKITGRSEQELAVMKIWELRPPDKIARAKKMFEEIKSRGQGGSSSLDIIKPDQTVVQIEFTAKLITIQGIEYIQSLVKDITKRKLSEKALAESELKYRNLYQSATVGLYRSRIDDGQILAANQAMANIMGYESLDQYIKEFKTAGHFADSSKREEMANIIKKNGRIDNFEVEAIKKDGSRMYVTISAVAYKDKGYYEGVIVDISERIKAERALEYRLQFEKLISDISTRFINLESDKIGLGINQALKQICSFARAEAGQVFLLSEDRKDLNLAYVWFSGIVGKYQDKTKEIPVARVSWLMERLRRFKSTAVTDINELPLEAKGLKAVMNEQKLKSKICVPMIFQGELIGFLGFSSISKRREWIEDEVALLKMVGQIFTNAIKRMEAQEKIIKNEYYLSKAQEMGRIGTWEMDIVKDKLVWTDENYRIFGVPIGTELTYKTFLDCVHPEDREYVNREWQAALEKKPYDLEHRIIVNGKIKWVREKAELEFDKKGNCIKGTGFTQDITEIKHAENEMRVLNESLEHKVIKRTRELKKSQERFKELWDKAPVAYHTLNNKGIITDVNNTEVELLGYKKEEMVGKPIFNFIIPGQRAEARRRFKDKLAGKKVEKKSDRFYLKKDGAPVCVSIDDILEYDSFNKVSGVRTTLIDITKKHEAEIALEESEEKYRSIVENATDFIFMIGKDLKVISLNEAAARVFGKKPEAVIGQSIHSLFPDTIAGGYAKNLKKVFETGQTNFTESAMSVGGNNSWISAILSPVRNSKGEVTAVMGISRDISESKRAEKRIQATNELLQLLNRANNRKEYLELVANLIKEWSGCHNVGIRIKNDQGDIPYEVYAGFSKKFWDSENWLNINEDQCACTRVIAGSPDKADRKAITSYGSWYCNNTLKFVEDLSQDERAKFRGNCAKSGFSTVAIMPIFLGKDTLGAIHLADKKADHLSREFVGLIESITPLIGEAIQKFNISEKHERAVQEIDRIFDISIDLLSVAGFDGYFKRVNPGFENILGYSEAEILAKPFIEFVHPDDRPATVKEFKKLLGGQKIIDFENRYRCRNGSYKWLSWKAIPMVDEGLVYSIAHDVTNNKLQAKVLQKSKASLMEAQRIAQVGNWDWNIKKNKFYWSDEIYRIFGLKPQEFNADYETFLSLVHPDDRDIVNKSIRQALKEKKSYNIEHRIILPDDKVKIVQQKARIYSNAGQPVRMVGTMQDITKNKQAEEAIKRGLEVQAVLNKLLKISMKETRLEKRLDNIIDTLISLPWFALESKGGIWLSLENKEELKLAAQRNLPSPLLNKCSKIPYGRCLCGRTARFGKIEYSNNVDKRHEVTYKGIEPHGHYCIPIKSKKKVLGVMNFYIREGHQYSYKEIDFLRAVSNIVAGMVERERADEALKKSEEKYRKLVDNADDGVAIINIDGFMTFFNQALQDIIGYNAEELKTLHILKYIHEKDKDWVIKRFRERLAGKRVPNSYEFRIKTKTGKTRYVSYSGAVIKEKSKIVGVQAIIRDITDNRRLQAKIEQAKKHYEQVIDTIQDGICVIDKNFKIASCNRVFSTKINLPIDSIKGRRCNEILPLYENRLLKGHCARLMCDKNCGTATVFKSGQALKYVEENMDEAGNLRYHSISIYPDKDSRGRIYQVVLTIRDITNRKKAEEEIRRLNEFNQRILDTSPVSMVVLNNTGTIIAANALANNLMGKKGKRVVGSKLLETNEIKKNKILLEHYDKLLNKGEPFYYDNLPYVSEDTSEKKFLNIIAVPLHDAKKKVEGAISMALDNTEAIKAKQKLEYLNLNLETKVIQRTKELDLINQKLSQVLELKSKFIADASHELRTPLTVVQGNLELAIREAQDQSGDIPETYSTIIGEVGRMSGILSDLTMLTNVDSRNEQIAYEKVNLGQLIKAAGQSLKVLADQKKIALIYNRGVKKIKVWGDEAKLEKLLLNIIRNAIKYTEPKGRVRIWTETINSEARVIVEDNGIGIPKEDLPFIFERFYRVEKGRSRAEGGTGLGLSICKWVAEAHRGKISVESKPGKGTVFTVHIPFDYKKHGLANTLF